MFYIAISSFMLGVVLSAMTLHIINTKNNANLKEELIKLRAKIDEVRLGK